MVASTQRPGAVTNMTVKEFDRREKEGEITDQNLLGRYNLI